MKIGLLVGSLRKNSWNKKLAKEVAELLDVETYMIDLSETPVSYTHLTLPTILLV